MAILLCSVTLIFSATPVAAQNDAGSGGDAGNTLGTAFAVTPFGLFHGELTSADTNDFYSFSADVGDQINIEIRNVLSGGTLPAPDNNLRQSFRLEGPSGVLLDTPNTNQGDTRVSIIAPATATYFFHVTRGPAGFQSAYDFCFVVVSGASHSCPDIGMRPIATFGEGSPHGTTVRVLLAPPTHGDLGNPFGPTALDYLTASVAAIHKWETSIDAFIADYPAYDYLDQIDIDVHVWDVAVPTVGVYDITISYIETSGTQFRGVASTCLDPPRCIVLSLFASSPRGGQIIPDYPEINDLKAVVMHEFAHSFGIGHTLSWDVTDGPDLMNSPATFVYGDGNPVGDGGERTPTPCPSSLDLYGLAKVYEWLDTGGVWAPPSATSYSLPGSIPYDLYC